VADLDFDAAIVIEDRVGGGGIGLAANPCLDGIETLGSLMDIVVLGDVLDGGEKLGHAFGAASDDTGGGQIAPKCEARAAARRTEPTGHERPRLQINH